MRRYLLRKLLLFLPILLAIITLTFFLVRLAPGGPFDRDKNVPEEVQRSLEKYYHLDEPIIKQYFRYLYGVIRFDFGPSFRKPSYTIREWILMRLPISVELGIYSLIFALFVGCFSGIISAFYQNTWIDTCLTNFAVMGICIPAFVIGPVLVLIFALQWEILPVAGWDFPQQKILPSISLGFVYSAYITRIMRSGIIEVMKKDYIRTAISKGASGKRILLIHALRGALQPLITFLGPATAGLLTGSFVVETIFQIPGLGREFVEATFNRDYTMIMGIVFVYAFLILILNLVVDIIQGYLDPRISYE